MGINENLEEVIKILKENAEKERTKKFKLPKKLSMGQKKKNYVTLMILNENGNIDFKKIQIEDQTIFEDKIPRLAAAGYIMYYKKNPIIFLPSWSLEPFNFQKDYELSLAQGRNTKGFKLLLARMERAATKEKASMPNAIKWVLGLGLAALIVYALMTGGG